MNVSSMFEQFTLQICVIFTKVEDNFKFIKSNNFFSASSTNEIVYSTNTIFSLNKYYFQFNKCYFLFKKCNLPENWKRTSEIILLRFMQLHIAYEKDRHRNVLYTISTSIPLDLVKQSLRQRTEKKKVKWRNKMKWYEQIFFNRYWLGGSLKYKSPPTLRHNKSLSKPVPLLSRLRKIISQCNIFFSCCLQSLRLLSSYNKQSLINTPALQSRKTKII